MYLQNENIDTLTVKRRSGLVGELPAAAPYIPSADKLPRLRRKLRARDLIRALHIRHAMRARRRMKKRKAALALSASAIGFASAGMVPPPDPLVASAEFAAQAESDGRQPAASMRASSDLRDAMIEEEGVRLTVYRDLAGYPTVGVGHLVRSEDGLSVGDRIDREQVIAFLDRDLRTAERAAARLAGDTPLYQHEFDALVDLVFNVGEGNVSPARSPRLNAALDAADYDAVARELHYSEAAGSRAKGLVYRSMRRANIFLDAMYEDPRDRT